MQMAGTFHEQHAWIWNQAQSIHSALQSTEDSLALTTAFVVS